MKKLFLLMFFVSIAGIANTFAQSTGYTVTQDTSDYGGAGEVYIKSENYSFGEGVINFNMEVFPFGIENEGLVELDAYIEYTDNSYSSDHDSGFCSNSVLPLSTSLTIDPSKTIKFIEFAYELYSPNGIYVKRITLTY